jgi:hypothetical protein
MKLGVEWNRPIPLKATRQNMIYSLDLVKLPNAAGVYTFGRRWGAGFEALYVGTRR